MLAVLEQLLTCLPSCTKKPSPFLHSVWTKTLAGRLSNFYHLQEMQHPLITTLIVQTPHLQTAMLQKFRGQTKPLEKRTNEVGTMCGFTILLATPSHYYNHFTSYKYFLPYCLQNLKFISRLQNAHKFQVRSAVDNFFTSSGGSWIRPVHGHLGGV